MHEWVCQKIAVVMLALLPVMALASPSQDDINQLILVSGVAEQLDAMPGLMQAGVAAEANNQTFSAQSAAALSNYIARYVLPSALQDGVAQALRAGLSEQEIAALLQWYRSDVGQQISAAERAADNPQAFDAVMASYRQLLADESRVAWAKKVDALLALSDRLVDQQVTLVVLTHSARMADGKQGGHVNETEFRAHINRQRAQMREAVSPMVWATLVYTYQSISDADLATYEAFLMRPETRKFYALLSQRIEQDSRAAVSRIFEAMTHQ